MRIEDSKVFVVGTGGIGCELLYCLAKSGFRNIEAIDKDTIELSNLNRQFLFKNQDIGNSKVETVQKVLKIWFPSLKIVSYHSDIISDSFNVKFYQRFDIIINALDNRVARSHVNKMSHYANVPLIDSGSGGYQGQVLTIKWNETECYDCVPHSQPKTFPFCTIRNTPTHIEHCVIWAKYIFEEIFSKGDRNNENYTKDTESKSLSRWFFENNDKTAQTLLRKVFISDIKYLQNMKNLWEKNPPPLALPESCIDNHFDETNQIDLNGLSFNNKIFNIQTWIFIFMKSFNELYQKNKNSSLEFDKDDYLCVAFISSCANIRAYNFHIDLASSFTIKTIAGNIVPSIASTNDIIASLTVIEAIKIVEEFGEPREVYLTNESISNKVISSMKRSMPCPCCHICSSNNMIYVKCKPENLTVSQLKNIVLKNALGISRCDVEIDGIDNAIILSADDTDNIDNLYKSLSDFGVKIGSIFNVQDFHTDRFFQLCIESDVVDDDQLFIVSNKKVEIEQSSLVEFNAELKAKKRKNSTVL